MKGYRNVALILLIIVFITILTLGITYRYMIAPVSKNDTLKMIEIKKGDSTIQIAKTLKDNHLIKNEFIFKLYIRMNKITNLQAGRYNFKESMNLKTIVEMINKGKGVNPDSFNITFPEGKNMRQIATIIAKYTNNTYDDVLNLLKDSKYIDTLIDKYWFLTDEIKQEGIYYPLEGYLFPDTYNITNQDVTIKEIFNIMLNQTDKILTKYKKDITKSAFSVHEFLTLASIIESEGINDDDRATIAGVFYNRLNIGKPFESCVTACYATKTDNCIPKKVDTDYNSPYNTYLKTLIGLPIGPISNPGEASISATISPEKHDYLYFVADKYKKVYFSKTYSEHLATIKRLKNENLYITE